LLDSKKTGYYYRGKKWGKVGKRGKQCFEVVSSIP
jgi:hypothetical protein